MADSERPAVKLSQKSLYKRYYTGFTDTLASSAPWTQVRQIRTAYGCFGMTGSRWIWHDGRDYDGGPVSLYVFDITRPKQAARQIYTYPTGTAVSRSNIHFEFGQFVGGEVFTLVWLGSSSNGHTLPILLFNQDGSKRHEIPEEMLKVPGNADCRIEYVRLCTGAALMKSVMGHDRLFLLDWTHKKTIEVTDRTHSSSLYGVCIQRTWFGSLETFVVWAETNGLLRYWILDIDSLQTIQSKGTEIKANSTNENSWATPHFHREYFPSVTVGPHVRIVAGSLVIWRNRSNGSHALNAATVHPVRDEEKGGMKLKIRFIKNTALDKPMGFFEEYSGDYLINREDNMALVYKRTWL